MSACLRAPLHRVGQVVFWGNPTTPGHVDSVDYYMSGDVMEVDAGQTHYTEQLIRLEGQAIWSVVSSCCGRVHVHAHVVWRRSCAFVSRTGCSKASSSCH